MLCQRQRHRQSMYCIASAVDLTVVSNLSLVSMTPVCDAFSVLVCITMSTALIRNYSPLSTTPITSSMSMKPLSSNFVVSMTLTDPVRYQSYQIPNLSDTKPIWYWTHLILNPSDTEPIWYPTYLIPNLSDNNPIRSEPLRSEPVRSEPFRSEPIRSEPIRSKPIRYQTYQIPNLSETELSDSEPIRFWTYQKPNLSDNEPIRSRAASSSLI